MGHEATIFARVLSDNDIRKVVLYRENVLARYASVMAARQTGQYGPQAAQIQVRFDPESFRISSQRYERYFREIFPHSPASLTFASSMWNLAIRRAWLNWQASLVPDRR